MATKHNTTATSKTQAQERYEHHYNEVLQRLQRIARNIKKHAQHFDNRNWGYVGDTLSHKKNRRVHTVKSLALGLV